MIAEYNSERDEYTVIYSYENDIKPAIINALWHNADVYYAPGDGFKIGEYYPSDDLVYLGPGCIQDHFYHIGDDEDKKIRLDDGSVISSLEELKDVFDASRFDSELADFGYNKELSAAFERIYNSQFEDSETCIEVFIER